MCVAYMSSGVSAVELGELLQKLGHPLDASTLNTVFSEYDLDGSGKIEFAEFLRLFRKNFLHIEVRILISSESGQSSASKRKKVKVSNFGQ